MLQSETMPGKCEPMTATTVPAIAQARPADADVHAAAAPAHVGLRYRADIDGLRAIAVSLVVLYHAGLGALPGGFVGVDVFFVISGYLITSVIVTERAFGRFTLVEFYRRRIQRLLPAYVIVAAATLITGYFLSIPSHYYDTAQGVAASAIYLSNFWFWRETGYFGGLAEIKPFIHTWSLSVEEQFYVVFPFALIVASRLRLGKRALIGLFVTLLLLSLGLSEWLLSRRPADSFYLLPFRAWELMIGAGLALAGLASPSRPAARAAAVVIGLAAILANGHLLRAEHGFPGLSALAACLGTALVLWAGGRGDAPSRALLENRAMVFLGRISYSLYLWHWPLFSYYRYYYFAAPPPVVACALIAASVSLAWASWKFVETPLRARDRWQGWRSFAFALASSGLIIAACLWIQLGEGLPERYAPRFQRLLSMSDEVREQTPAHLACLGVGDAMLLPERACTVGASGPKADAVLWGDSHAFYLIESLARQFARRNRAMRFHGHPGCPPIPGVDIDFAGKTEPCSAYSERLIAHIMSDRSIKTVFIAARYSSYINGTQGATEPDGGLDLKFPPIPGLIDAPKIDAYIARFEAMVRRLLASGKRVVIVQPLPEIGYDVPVVFSQMKIRDADPDQLALPWESYVERHQEVRSSMSRLARLPGVALIDPTTRFCDGRLCRFELNGELLYRDDDHLSPAGADLITPAMFDAAAVPLPTR